MVYFFPEKIILEGHTARKGKTNNSRCSNNSFQFYNPHVENLILIQNIYTYNQKIIRRFLKYLQNTEDRYLTFQIP